MTSRVLQDKQAHNLSKHLIYLIRHGKAGDRTDVIGEELVRPLTKKGSIQAIHLADFLAGWPLTRIISSPYLRCIQTVQPLSGKNKVPLETTNVLGEVTSKSNLVELLEAITKTPGAAALCTHGNIIPEILHILGLYSSKTLLCEKGSLYIVDLEASTANYYNEF